MDDRVGLNLMESMLDMEVSMDILSDQLDRISIHSSAGSESGHSSSRYFDSAFDSGDSTSYHSQGAVPEDPSPSSYHQDPAWHDSSNWEGRSYSNKNQQKSIRTPPPSRRSPIVTQQNLTSTRAIATGRKISDQNLLKQSLSKTSSKWLQASMDNPSSPQTVKSMSRNSAFEESYHSVQPSGSGTRNRTGREKLSKYQQPPAQTNAINSISHDTYQKFSDNNVPTSSSPKITKRINMDRTDSVPSKTVTSFQNIHEDKKSLESTHSSWSSKKASNRSRINVEISTAVSPLQAEVLHMPADNSVLPHNLTEKKLSQDQNNPQSSLKLSPSNSSFSAVNPSVSDTSVSPYSSSSYLSAPTQHSPSRDHNTNDFIDEEHSDSSGSGLSTPVLQSSLSSLTFGSLSSRCSTPTDITTLESKPQLEETVVQRPLTPQVTILQPGEEGSSHAINITRSPRQPRVPKRGTVFYQDSLNPPKSPHLRSYRETSHKSDDHTEGSGSPQARRNIPRRNPSILQRLVRKRGSFKQEGLIKQRLPVKRSLSNRITYHIRKGWIDYEEDLNLISQPIQPRAVGRMVDKKSGKFHMVQLYRPPSGKYGIYISETSGKKGVFISRFEDQNAAKFYNGLISPGDQIVRVNGQNISEESSVDDVYDLMTASDSVIFTVIPISMRSDW